MENKVPKYLIFPILNKMGLSDLATYCQISKNSYDRCEEFFKDKVSLKYTDIDLSYKPNKMSYAMWFESVSRQNPTNMLFVGIDYKDIGLVSWAIYHGADVSEKYILTSAVDKGNYEIINFLIKNKANVNEVGGEPLAIAAKHGRADLIRLLVSAGANVSTGLALNNAARGGYYYIVKFLVENGIKDEEILASACLQAYIHNHTLVVNFLVEHGAELNQVLTYAIGQGYYNVVKRLLEQGVKAAWDTLLVNSAKYGWFDLLKLLVDDIISVNPGQLLYVAYPSDWYTRPRFLIEARIKILQEALYQAIANGHEQIMIYLINAGVNVRELKFNPLVLASKKGHYNLVKYLIEHQVNDNLNNALFEAIVNGHDQIMLYLIAQGADIKSLPFDPLRLVAIRGYYNIVKYLYENGYRSDAKLALSGAKYAGHSMIVQYLINQGVNTN